LDIDRLVPSFENPESTPRSLQSTDYIRGLHRILRESIFSAVKNQRHRLAEKRILQATDSVISQFKLIKDSNGDWQYIAFYV
jgi:hypothetical protein